MISANLMNYLISMIRGVSYGITLVRAQGLHQVSHGTRNSLAWCQPEFHAAPDPESFPNDFQFHLLFKS